MENEAPAWILLAVFFGSWAIVIGLFLLLPHSVTVGILAVMFAFIWPKKGW